MADRARKHLVEIVCTVVYLLGVVWRYLFIFVAHDPRKYAYSDMKMYMGWAKRFADPAVVLRPTDVTHPPGMGLVYSWLYQHDPSWLLAMRVQFVVAILAPLAVGLLAWAAFDRRSGALAVAAASLYFPFVDYAGYFLSEIWFIFALPLTFALWLFAVRRKRLSTLFLATLACGVLLSLATSLKSVALLGMACFVGTWFLFSRELSWKWKAVAVMGLSLGAAPLTAAMSARCTRASGRTCFISNKAPADFLLGHYGRIGMLAWHDQKTGGTLAFGSPASAQHGYRENKKVEFGLFDGPANSKEAWDWIGKHPKDAVALSFEHVYDIFFGSLPWPSISNELWVGAMLWHHIFVYLVLFPVGLLLYEVARSRGLVAAVKSREFLVLTPLFGVIAAVFIATGEARYRIPFDTCLLVLAMEAYRRAAAHLWAKRRAKSEVPASDEIPPAAVARDDDHGQMVA